MAHRAVFLDRDNSLIDDPGYLADPQAVRLLPGVEHALKRLAKAGWKLVVVTNQSAVGRGLLTEEALGAIHAEMERQLAQHGACLDAIYYCPYLSDASVEAYARDSDERKPRPGMLLRAARDMGLDLSASWMIGDSPRDIEAGQRAGCRTIRIRHGDQAAHGEAAAQDEDVQADFTVRNLTEAAQVIVRESPPAPEVLVAATAPAIPPAPPAGKPSAPEMTDSEVLRELLQLARQFIRLREGREFSSAKLIAGVAQGLALLAFIGGALKLVGLSTPTASFDRYWQGMGYLAMAGVLQLVALTFFLMNRQD